MFVSHQINSNFFMLGFSLLKLNRVRLPSKRDTNPLKFIDSLFCTSCKLHINIKSAVKLFVKQTQPRAGRHYAQSMSDFSWGTRGQSDCYAVNLVAPQNIKVAQMMNDSKIACERCGDHKWKAGNYVN
jgi:hypothetical protein